jgi:translation initiation factor 5B
MGQTQETIRKKLEEKDEFECTVIEVKVIEGLGTTVDVVLVNGIIKVGDTIVLSGMNGPIVTKIRALLTPHPMKEMRVKGDYMHHKQIKGAMGIKISAPDMEHAMAGTQVFKCDTPEEIEEAKQNISDDLIDILDKYVDKTAEGVSVQALTIGSLEALLEYLYQMKIPVCSVNIGPVHKKDILKCMKSTAAGGERQHKEYATLLAFDVKVTPEAREFAEEEGIKVFTAEIIYHLFDSFTEYVKKCEDERKGDQGSKAVFPCILEVSHKKHSKDLLSCFYFIDGQRCLFQCKGADHYRCECDGRSA